MILTSLPEMDGDWIDACAQRLPNIAGLYTGQDARGSSNEPTRLHQFHVSFSNSRRYALHLQNRACLHLVRRGDLSRAALLAGVELPCARAGYLCGTSAPLETKRPKCSTGTLDYT